MTDKKRVRTVYSTTVAIEKIETHKASMAKRGWTFERSEPLGNGCTTHVWVYYRKSTESTIA